MLATVTPSMKGWQKGVYDRKIMIILYYDYISMLPLTGFEKSTVKCKVLDDTFVQPLFFNFHLGLIYQNY